MRLPATMPPNSATAMRAASTEPGPVESAELPDMSVSTPILTTSPEIWALATEASVRPATQPAMKA